MFKLIKEVSSINTVAALREALKDLPMDIPVSDGLDGDICLAILEDTETGEREIEIR